MSRVQSETLRNASGFTFDRPQKQTKETRVKRVSFVHFAFCYPVQVPVATETNARRHPRPASLNPHHSCFLDYDHLSLSR